MRRVVGWLLATLALSGVSACAGSNRSAVVDCQDFVQSPSQYDMQFQGPAGQESQREFNFICRAAVYGRAQLTYARMAQERSANPAVKDFAATVVSTQSETSQRLSQIAIQQEGVTAPRGLDAAHLAVRDQLAQLSGNAFDRAYLQNAVEDGRAAIDLFRKESSTMEPVMGKFAAAELPTIEQRVSQAQGLLPQAGY
jgi:putative membrane protein